MNELKIFNNKSIPFEWDDIDWLQQSVRDAFYALFTSIGISAVDSFRLSGAEVTVGSLTASVTAGYIVIEGEICQVDAATITWSGTKYVKFEVSETNDATGTEQDSLGNTVECYRVRKAVIAAKDTDVGMPYDAPLMLDYIRTYVINSNEFVTAVEVVNNNSLTGWTDIDTFYNDHVAGTPTPQYRVNSSNMVEFRGGINCQDGTSGKCFSIPTSVAPADTLYFPLCEDAGGGVHVGYITSDGEMYVYSGGYGSTGKKYHLMTIPPYIK